MDYILWTEKMGTANSALIFLNFPVGFNGIKEFRSFCRFKMTSVLIPTKVGAACTGTPLYPIVLGSHDL